MRLIRGVDERFIEVEYNEYFFDDYFLMVVSGASVNAQVVEALETVYKLF